MPDARSSVRMTWTTIVAVLALVLGVAGAGGAGAAPGQIPPDGRNPEGATGSPLAPTGRVDGSKTSSSRVARTDPAVVGRTDATPVSVLVKLDYDALASYAGGSRGAPATSPATTGRPLTRDAATSSPYARQVADREAAIVAEIQRVVPEATILRSLRVVYGGVAVALPANRAAELLAIDGVVAVQADEPRQLLTDSSTEFIGAPPVWSQLGGQDLAGEGVLFGSLDSGIWPEHPSFADNPDLGPAPTDTNGDPLTCDFGENPLAAGVDPFVCNSKLVGGEPFLDAYNFFEGGETFPDSARDSDGHGTHTASTSAGDVVDSAPIFGIERGPLSGVAPGAWVAAYKVCGTEGCFPSDSAAAVESAILDGVDVINFSISGGTDPFTDAVEMAFLDAYNAGIFVAASAGNEGPGPSTASHLSPWVTTVAASTQTREFRSHLTLTDDDGALFEADGVSIGVGLSEHEVVRAEDVPGYTDPGCLDEPPAADTFADLLVVCVRGPNRVQRGFNVYSGGGAGMILANPELADVETDNHFLPVIHIADGTDLFAFLDGSTAPVFGSFTPGTATDGQGDVMAAFSSRGPAGTFLKPDVTAPGVQILAGNTPFPDHVAAGPPGEYFQAIAGTSMSSPHVAGSAILLRALHATWTPGQIKSALMTTATTDVLKEDLVTPADPFDMGSGRIVVNGAADPGLTIAETGANFLALAPDPLTAINLNIPSINAPIVPGRVTTTRTVTNVGSGTAVYNVTTTSPAGSSITVSPSRITVPAGAQRTVTITINADGAVGQQFGEVRFAAAGRATLHLPVAFVPSQGSVSLASQCVPDNIEIGSGTSCTMTATNNSFDATTVDLTTTVTPQLQVTDADPTAATHTASSASLIDLPLAGRNAGVPSLEDYSEFLGDGYVPIDLAYGAVATPIGDEEALEFETSPFLYNGVTYTSMSVVSNGYIIAGGPATSPDIQCCPPQQLPSPAPPNNVLAPFWTDVDGSDPDGPGPLEAPDGILVTEVDFGPFGVYTIIEFRLNAFGTDDLKVFQVWIGHNGVQDITFNYDPDFTNTDGLSTDLTIGAENENGSGGVQIGNNNLPDTDLRVVSTDPEPGDSATLTVHANGVGVGNAVVHTEMTTAAVPGVTEVDTPVAVFPTTTDINAFVARAYVDFLHRDVDQAGLDYWSGLLSSGAITRYGFALALASTDEWLGEVVDGHYEGILGRAPDPAGRAFWIGQLRSGLPEASLVGLLIGSAEFFVASGSTVGGFVDHAYDVIFHRAPDAGGRAFWISQVNGGLPRSAVGVAFYQSLESRRNRVANLYQALLHRGPDPAGQAFWADVLLTESDLALAAFLAASDEYFNRVP